MWGLMGSASPFLLQIKNGKGKKLRRNIKIHGELVTFICHFPRFRKVFIFVILRIRGSVHDPQKPLFLSLDTPDYSKSCKKNPASESQNLENLGIAKIRNKRCDFGKSQNLENRTFWKIRVQVRFIHS